MIIPSKEFWNQFKATNGALSCCEALAIMNIASQAPNGGKYGELGSHKGKSAMAAIFGLKPTDFFLDDLIFEDNSIVAEAGRAIQKAVGYTLNLSFYQCESLILIPRLSNISYVFVDTGVHDDMVMEEVKLLEDRMVSGGIICFHDYLNQFTAVERAYDYLLSTNKFDRVSIDWEEIINYVRDNDLETGNNSWHVYEENPFPNFVGALRRK